MSQATVNEIRPTPRVAAAPPVRRRSARRLLRPLQRGERTVAVGRIGRRQASRPGVVAVGGDE